MNYHQSDLAMVQLSLLYFTYGNGEELLPRNIDSDKNINMIEIQKSNSLGMFLAWKGRSIFYL